MSGLRRSAFSRAATILNDVALRLVCALLICLAMPLVIVAMTGFLVSDAITDAIWPARRRGSQPWAR